MLHVNRRNLLGSSVALMAATTASRAASAVARRSPGVAIVTNINLVNTSQNATTAGTVTQLIGCPFRAGDIPKGTWPQFQLADGTSVPCTILERLATTWNDGSLKFVPVMLSIPESVPGNASIAVNILSGGQMPPPSSRKLADFRQGIDPQIQVDGLDNLSGTWIMDLHQALKTRTKVVHYGTGSAGAVWKVRANAQQAGVNHGQLICDFYIASLANPDGSLKGLRILGKVKLPYYDTSAPMNWVSFSRFQLCLNSQGTLIRDCFGSNFGAARAYNFTWNSGSSFSADHGYSTANAGDYAYCTRLSTTGALPTGLQPDTSYFTGNPTATQIGFATNAQNPGGNLVSATDGGSGTQTATPYPYLAYFGAIFTAGPSGMWDFVQGSGSDSADTTLRCQINQSYWVSTELLPSYDLTITPTSNSQTSYWANCSEPVTRYLEETGERNDLGILPTWYVRHFLTQASVDESAVRVISLIGGQFSVGLENSTTLSFPCVNNGFNNSGGTYRGMPAPNTTFRFLPGESQTSGFPYGDTTNPKVRIAGFYEQDTTHMPQFNYYPYLFTGEPWHLDMLLEHAHSAVFQRNGTIGTANISLTSFSLGNSGSGVRNLQVGSNPVRYGIAIGCSLASQRADAWGCGLLAAAAGIGPDRNGDCTSYKRYFNDMNSSTWAAAVDISRALPDYGTKYGLWSVPYQANWQLVDHWQMAYLGAALALACQITEDKNAWRALTAHVKWFDHVVARFGGWHVGCYQTIIKTADYQGAPQVLGDPGIAFHGPNINWTNGGPFTLQPYSNYVPANGDIYMFTDSVIADAQVVPAGFSKYVPYYMVGLSGSQFYLASSPGGSPIALTDSYSGPDAFYIVSTTPPSTGSMTAIGSPESYNTEVLGMLNYAVAAGIKVAPATLSDLSYRNQQAGNSFVSDPKWGMTNTFTQNEPKRFSRRFGRLRR